MDPLSRLNIRLAYEHGIIEYPELCELLSEQAFCVRPADLLGVVRSSPSALQSNAGAKTMKAYAILTRFGHYFEVTAWDEDHARDEAQKDIDAGECPQPGDAIEHIDEIAGLAALVGDIRQDLAEIVAK